MSCIDIMSSSVLNVSGFLTMDNCTYENRKTCGESFFMLAMLICMLYVSLTLQQCVQS